MKNIDFFSNVFQHYFHQAAVCNTVQHSATQCGRTQSDSDALQLPVDKHVPSRLSGCELCEVAPPPPRPHPHPAPTGPPSEVVVGVLLVLPREVWTCYRKGHTVEPAALHSIFLWFCILELDGELLSVCVCVLDGQCGRHRGTRGTGTRHRTTTEKHLLRPS